MIQKPQHILRPKNWDEILVVGWDPALKTYYAQVRTIDNPPDDSEEYIPLWLMPKPGEITTPHNLEIILNKALDDRWPAVRFTNNLISNLEADKLDQEPDLKPPCVFEFYPPEDEDDEYFILDIKDWFFENYESALESSENNVVYNAKEELLKNFGNVFPESILSRAADLIEVDSTKWVVAEWRIS